MFCGLNINPEVRLRGWAARARAALLLSFGGHHTLLQGSGPEHGVAGMRMLRPQGHSSLCNTPQCYEYADMLKSSVLSCLRCKKTKANVYINQQANDAI